MQFCLIVALCATAYGNNTNPCTDTLGEMVRSAFLFHPGEPYLVHLDKNSRIYRLKFIRYVRKDKELFGEFQDLKSRRPMLIPVREVMDSRLDDTPSLSERVLYSVLFNAIMHPALAHAMARIMFRPFRPLVKLPGLDVVGNFTASKSVAERVARDLVAFDTEMETLGFTKPEKTRVLLSHRSLLPSAFGPFAIRLPTLHLFGGIASSTIAMNPIVFQSTAGSTSVLWHERTHSILGASYHGDSFVLANQTVQEALADFIPTLLLGNPKITSPGFRRNVKTRNAISVNRKKMAVLTDLDRDDGHDNSLFFSNVLWECKESLGDPAMKALLKPFVDSLNAYYPEHAKRSKPEYKRNGKDPRQATVYDLEYFLAVLRKSAEGTPGSAAIDKVVTKKIAEYGLDPKRIDDIQQHLVASPLQKPASHPVLTVLAAVYGIVGLAGEAALVYAAIPSSWKHFIRFDEDEAKSARQKSPKSQKERNASPARGSRD